MNIGKELRGIKLAQLVKSEGFESEDALLEAAMLDSVSPAICIEMHCDYVTDMEPDQDAGYCEVCGGNTVVSALVLAELI